VTAEHIKLQANASGGTTNRIRFGEILILNLTDDLTENTDWAWHERATDDALSTTATDGGSVTFTPGTASHDWLVLSYAQLNAANATNSWTSRISRSGEATSTTPTCSDIPTHQDIQGQQLHSRVFSLGTSSNTFKEQSLASASAHTRLHSTIFALNLNKFAHHFDAYNDGDTATLGTDITVDTPNPIVTDTVAPTNTGVFVIGATFSYDVGQYQRTFSFRGQTYVDGEAQSDLPAGMTAAALVYQDSGISHSDEIPMFHLTGLSMTGGSTYRTDIDVAASSVTSAPTAQHRSLWGFSVELPAVAGGPNLPSVSDTVTVAEGTTLYMGLNIPLMKLT
jgi:hypothetical protein